MISDVVPWKRALRGDRRTLARWIQLYWQEHDQAYFVIERRVFLSAFAIRRILETRQLYPSNIKYTLEVLTFQRNQMNTWHPSSMSTNVSMVLENYYIDRPQKESISLRTISNTIIHSFLFFPAEWANIGISGFMVCSDHTKDDRLVAVSWNEYFKMLDAISADDAGEP